MKIQGLYIGVPEKIKDIKTSLRKSAVDEINVLFHHIDGDDVNNKDHHGGSNRVLNQFPIESYDILKTYFPKVNFISGSLGENLLTKRMNENTVCIGDTYKIGDAECVVTEPRKPCWTIDYVFSQKGIARFMQDNCLTGWFYRILKEGRIKNGDHFQLTSRRYPELSVANCIEALLIEPDSKVLKSMVDNPILSSNWKKPAQRILVSNRIEDDFARLKS